MYSKEEIFKAISSVIDPEVGFNIVELGLIYDAKCDEDFNIFITMTLSTKACPLHQMILQWVEDAIKRELSDTKSVKIDLVWEPVWSIEMASDEVKDKLSFM